MNKIDIDDIIYGAKGYVMYLNWQKKDFKEDIDFIMELQKDNIAEFWSASLFKWYPDLDRQYSKSLPEPERMKYIYDKMEKQSKIHAQEISKAISAFDKAWQPVSSKLNDIYSAAFFNNDCSKIFNNMTANVGLNPVCPRNVSDGSFDVFFKQTPDVAISTATHEMTHFIWFYFWRQYFHDNPQEYDAPHLKWLLSEIVVETINRNSEIHKLSQNNNKYIAYSYFYDMKINGELLFDTMKRLYMTCKTLQNFMEQSYKYCKENEKELREKIRVAETKVSAQKKENITDNQIKEQIKNILLQVQLKESESDNPNAELMELTKNYPEARYDERLFMVTGEQLFNSGFTMSCGHRAKLFCYINSKQKSPLDVKIMISTTADHFIDSWENHTLPCVKMSDGQYYAIDPGIVINENTPIEKLPIISKPVIVGKQVEHILQHFKDKQSKVMALMSWPEYEKQCSVFEKFLEIASERDDETKIIFSEIKQILEKGISNSIYKLCKETLAVNNVKLPIYVARFDNNDTWVLLKLKDGYYHLDLDRKYVVVQKQRYTKDKNAEYLEDLEDKRYKSKILWIKKPAEYIKWRDDIALKQNAYQELKCKK